MTTDINDYLQRKTAVPGLRLVRLTKTIQRQKTHSVICPDMPRLEGKVALVTGGSSGIGFETCRGLLQRGAEVIMASSNSNRLEEACEALRVELGRDIPITSLSIDLGDLNAVASATDLLSSTLGERKLDILIANAGIWPRKYSRSAQGYEIAFAINVLGHFLLIRCLLMKNLFADAMRLVNITGDIYIFTKSCSADYTYRTDLGGMLAYCRSKLGNIWIGAELQRRYPNLSVFHVHPGVVATALGGRNRSIKSDNVSWPEISCERGAQTSLVCATQSSLEAGGYYHNTLGLMQLKPNDPALDEDKALALYENCEMLCEKWLV